MSSQVHLLTESCSKQGIIFNGIGRIFIWNSIKQQQHGLIRWLLYLISRWFPTETEPSLLQVGTYRCFKLFGVGRNNIKEVEEKFIQWSFFLATVLFNIILPFIAGHRSLTGKKCGGKDSFIDSRWKEQFCPFNSVVLTIRPLFFLAMTIDISELQCC